MWSLRSFGQSMAFKRTSDSRRHFSRFARFDTRNETLPGRYFFAASMASMFTSSMRTSLPKDAASSAAPRPTLPQPMIVTTGVSTPATFASSFPGPPFTACM